MDKVTTSMPEARAGFKSEVSNVKNSSLSRVSSRFSRKTYCGSLSKTDISLASCLTRFHSSVSSMGLLSSSKYALMVKGSRQRGHLHGRWRLYLKGIRKQKKKNGCVPLLSTARMEVMTTLELNGFPALEDILADRTFFVHQGRARSRVRVGGGSCLHGSGHKPGGFLMSRFSDLVVSSTDGLGVPKVVWLWVWLWLWLGWLA